MRCFLLIFLTIFISASWGEIVNISDQSQDSVEEEQDILRLPTSWSAKDSDKAQAAQVWQIINKNREGREDSTQKLHVAYLAFRDAAPHSGYKERLGGILKTIRLYYADQMAANGYPAMTFPLDLDENGNLVVHVVYMNAAVSGVEADVLHQLGLELIRKELKEKGIEIQNDYVLTFLPENLKNGSLAGEGEWKGNSGHAWVFDSPKMSIEKLGNKKAVAGEEGITEGMKVSKRVGTIAHVLGQAFGVPHTGADSEYFTKGESLMSLPEYGFGAELRGEESQVFLLPANAMALASRPLFNGKKSNVSLSPDKCRYSDFALSPVKDGGILEGRALAAEEGKSCYAVSIHLDPCRLSEGYEANASVALVDGEGKFELEFKRPGYRGYVRIMQSAYMTDGSCDVRCFDGEITEEGLISPALEESAWFQPVVINMTRGRLDQARAECERILTENANVPVVARRASLWKRAVNADQLKTLPPLSAIPEEVEKACLADYENKGYTTGYGGIITHDAPHTTSQLLPQPVFRNKEFDRYIMIHANGSIGYDLESRWKYLTMNVGVPSGKEGSIQLKFRNGEKIIHVTRVLKNGEFEEVNLPIQGVETLWIDVLDAGDGNDDDWCALGDPYLRR